MCNIRFELSNDAPLYSVPGDGPYPAGPTEGAEAEGYWQVQRIAHSWNGYGWSSEIARVTYNGASGHNYGGPYFVRVRSTGNIKIVSKAGEDSCSVDCSACEHLVDDDRPTAACSCAVTGCSYP